MAAPKTELFKLPTASNRTELMRRKHKKPGPRIRGDGEKNSNTSIQSECFTNMCIYRAQDENELRFLEYTNVHRFLTAQCNAIG